MGFIFYVNGSCKDFVTRQKLEGSEKLSKAVRFVTKVWPFYGHATGVGGRGGVGGWGVKTQLAFFFRFPWYIASSRGELWKARAVSSPLTWEEVSCIFHESHCNIRS